MPGHVVAMGGFDETLLAYALGLSRAARPVALFVPTAVGDAPERIEEFYALAPGRGLDPDHLGLFGIPDEPLERVARADVIVVSGGNTANMLAVWRLHGVDRAIREAWLGGTVLTGWSAGGNCWFDGSVTDSFTPGLDPLDDGLALLPGSFCPHYDGEERRRPVYERLVAEGTLPPGLACDDGAAVHFDGTELVEGLAGREGALAWSVGPEGSEPLPTRLLP